MHGITVHTCALDVGLTERLTLSCCTSARAPATYETTTARASQCVAPWRCMVHATIDRQLVQVASPATLYELTRVSQAYGYELPVRGS